ncbi:MAG: zinc ABC transporter substrate-binding protein [Clostridiales bacterium]|nr:zinc ABC transporter substrate-binding protein [Clostridiales bacterium]
MKKRVFCFLAAFCLAASVSACKHSVKGTEKKLSIVTTIFPEYDWVMSILGEEKDVADVTMLLDNGVDLHSYQPSAEDILKITSCDMFIYVGGESDEWVEDVLKESSNKDMVVIDLLEVLGDQVKEEEVVEGMEHEHDHDEDHDHDHDHEEDHDHEHEEVEYDEHVWLSLRNAKTFCVRIESELEKLDPAHKDSYKKNLDAYVAELDSLDAEYQKVVGSAAKKTILFADRFPFRYLTDDYGLTYYAAFAGCSAESEASFETIVFLAQKVDELDLGVVLTIEGAKHKIAETVVENASKEGVRILVMDSLQSVTGSDVKNGVSYISVMKSNLEVLKEALG